MSSPPPMCSPRPTRKCRPSRADPEPDPAGVRAIVINASSPDALNGAVKQACDAGIVVVSFDAPSPSLALGASSSTSRTWACRKSST